MRFLPLSSALIVLTPAARWLQSAAPNRAQRAQVRHRSRHAGPQPRHHRRLLASAGWINQAGSGWVDTGDPNFGCRDRRLAGGTYVTCDGQSAARRTAAPLEIMIGGMKISSSSRWNEIKIPAGIDAATSSFPGTSAEIKIPSTVLRNYDVLINFPDREFSIGAARQPEIQWSKEQDDRRRAAPASFKFPARLKTRITTSASMSARPISFLSEELFDKLAAAHPDWPHMTGAVGPANMGEAGDDETNWKLMRVDRIQYGPLYLTDVAVAEFPKNFSDFFERDAGAPIAGLIGRGRADELSRRSRLRALRRSISISADFQVS